MTAALGAPELRRAALASLDVLRARQAEIDEANVYPVPDGDTGTNLVLTMESVARALAEVPDETPEVCRAVTVGSLMGARGNSGVILAQVLRGICEFLADGDAGGGEVALGLKRGADLAYEAVLHPVEGTMLTVARAAAEAAASGDGDLAGVLDAAAAGARDALARTPDQLPVLKQAGVVDAGGMGLVAVLEAFADSVAGRATAVTAVAPRGLRVSSPRVRPREEGSSEYAYEVQYLLAAPDGLVAGLRGALGQIGDSVAVVGGGETWKVHVHTNDVGRAIELGLEAGRPSQISVVAFEEQIARGAIPVEEEPTRGIPLARAAARASLVAVASGEGLQRLFRELGAAVVIDGGRTMNPSVSEILEGLATAPNDDVIVLPNNDNVTPAALQAAARSPKRVQVLPTKDPAHGLAVAVAFGDARSAEDNLVDMAQALERVRSGVVSIAVRAAETPVGPVRAGQAFALAAKRPVAVGDDPVAVAVALAEHLAPDDAEVVTVVAGEGADEQERARLAEALAVRLPELAAELHDGGQPAHRYLIAVE